MDDFRLIFDITQNNVSVDGNMPMLMLFGAVAVAMAIFLLVVRLTISRGRKTPYKLLFLLFWGVFALVFGVRFYISFKSNKNELLNAYKANSGEVVEGVVHVLHQQPYSGHTKGDIIEIDGKKIEINYFKYTNSYNRTISHGGVLNEGVYAKIYCFEGKVLRIEIKETRIGELEMGN